MPIYQPPDRRPASIIEDRAQCLIEFLTIYFGATLSVRNRLSLHRQDTHLPYRIQ